MIEKFGLSISNDFCSISILLIRNFDDLLYWRSQKMSREIVVTFSPNINVPREKTNLTFTKYMSFSIEELFVLSGFGITGLDGFTPLNGVDFFHEADPPIVRFGDQHGQPFALDILNGLPQLLSDERR